ncbi:MAG: minor capsid protein [Lachnospiraceae bacterium]|nr:minor capsid protein [Lachnospiraceae bacterium]
MNNTIHQEMVKEAVKDKFRSSDTKDSAVVPRYPGSAEREYERVSRSYMKLLNDSLKKHLPAIMSAVKHERTDSRYDSRLSFERKLRLEMEEIAKELEQSVGKFGLDDYIEKIAKLMSKQTTREWKRTVKKTLGVDIFEDYYKGEAYEQALKQWVSENVLKIKTIPQDTLGSLEKIILDGYQNGTSLRQMQRDIQNEYNISKRNAELLARDQVATLNASITKMQQTDAGVKKYKWSTSKDSRVRDCHRELHGKIISWDDPPEMWYMTKKGKVYTGRHCNPGEDYACRCVAIPIFDVNTVDVPIKEGK